MNDPDQPTAKTFSQLAGSTSAQSAFFTSLIQIMQNYGFDGVDIDWEYPVAPERSGNPQDFANYPTLLTNLKSALGESPRFCEKNLQLATDSLGTICSGFRS